MKNSIPMGIIAVLSAANLYAQPLAYPETRKSDVSDTLFGYAVADPYRWLEDDKSSETGAWVKAENAVTEGYLNKIPFRKKLKERLTKLWNYEKYSTPIKKGEFYYFTKNDGIQNQPVICSRKGITGKEKELLDINKLSLDGTVALTGFAVSNNGKYLAYATAKAGSDWETIKIMDMETEKPMSDELNWVKFSELSWKGNTLYYSRYPDAAKGSELTKKNENHRVYSHVVGNPQSQDQIIFENREHPLRTYTAQITDDEKFLIIYESESTSGNAMYVRDLNKKDKEAAEWKYIVSDFKNDFRVVDNIGNTLLVITNRNAPKGRLVAIGADKIEEDKWKTIIKEKDDEVLQNAVLSGDKLITLCMKDATSKLYVNTGTGVQENEIPLPSLGTVDAISGTRTANSLLFSFSSFTVAPTIYKFDLGSKKPDVLFGPKLDFKAENFETEQVKYKSKDGTEIPMFIVHKKGMELDGTAPTMIYAYGGFNISQTPSFKVERLAFLEQGGVFALPCIRGGGEYGEEWHQAGMKLNKQNVFDDFMAAAEYLQTERWTSPEFTAITGRSNGGFADRCMYDTASRTIQGCSSRSWGNGHAALP